MARADTIGQSACVSSDTRVTLPDSDHYSTAPLVTFRGDIVQSLDLYPEGRGKPRKYFAIVFDNPICVIYGGAENPERVTMLELFPPPAKWLGHNVTIRQTTVNYELYLSLDVSSVKDTQQ